MQFSKESNIEYLDEQPELYTALEAFVSDLELDPQGFGSDNWFAVLECRRRDGFIPHSHNFGGFDVYNLHSISHEDEQDEDGTMLFHGFRIMYEGTESEGVHKLCVYYSQWDEHDYRGIGGAPTQAQEEITFSNPDDMVRQLSKFVNEIANNLF